MAATPAKIKVKGKKVGTQKKRDNKMIWTRLYTDSGRES